MDNPAPVINPPPAPPESSGPNPVYVYRGPRPMRREIPLATFVLIAANVIVFALTSLAGGLRSPDALLDFGALYGPYIRAGEYWRLIAGMFLHGGIAHLTLNMFGLYVLGGILERVYGYGRFSVIYVGAGIGAGCLSTFASSDVAVGASGAILGLAGAMVATGFLRPDDVPPRLRRVFGLRLLPFVAADLLLGVVINFAPAWFYQGLGVRPVRIDNWAHIGGLFSGMVLAGVIPPLSPRAVIGNPHETQPQRRSEWFVIFPAAIVVVGLSLTAVHYPEARTVTRLLEQSAQLHATRKDDQALARLEQAERLNPHDERIHERLGLLYLEQNRVPEAVKQYQAILALNPSSLDAKLGLAQSYKQTGDTEKANQYLKGLEASFPDDAEDQYTLGAIYAEHNMYPEAIARFEEALRLNSNLAVAHNDLAWLYATSEDPHYRDPEKALDHARRAVEMDHWKQPAFIDTLAEALYANKEYGEAVKVQRKTLALDPNNTEYKNHMSRYRKAAGV